MNQLRDIQRLLIPRRPSQGEVLSVSGSSAQVQTIRGVVNTSVPADLLIQPGQRVQIEGGAIIGVIKSTRGLMVYQV